MKGELPGVVQDVAADVVDRGAVESCVNGVQDGSRRVRRDPESKVRKRQTRIGNEASRAWRLPS